MAARAALGALWGVALPALATAVVLRYLIPVVGAGVPGVVARLGQRHPLLFGCALFLGFSLLGWHWRRWLPGEREAPVRMASRRRAWGPLLAVASGLAAALVLRRMAAPYEVLSGSMLPTLQPGDLVGGNKLARPARSGSPPRRGDVIVFGSAAVGLREVAAPEQLVKRVIGLPGDRIEMRGSSPIINGWEVPSCDAGGYAFVLPDDPRRSLFGRLRVELLDGRAYLTFYTAPPLPFDGPFVVPPGQVFVLGDNRTNSLDSRAWNHGRGGGVPLPDIDARVQWFLMGKHRGGEPDLGRLFRPVDTLEARLHIEGVDARDLEAGIARCLAKPRIGTSPPGPEALEPVGAISPAFPGPDQSP